MSINLANILKPRSSFDLGDSLGLPNLKQVSNQIKLARKQAPQPFQPTPQPVKTAPVMKPAPAFMSSARTTDTKTSTVSDGSQERGWGGVTTAAKEAVSPVTKATQFFLPESLQKRLERSLLPKQPTTTWEMSPEMIAKQTEIGRKEEEQYGFGMSRPAEFGKGVARGASSLSGSIVGGTLNWAADNWLELTAITHDKMQEEFTRLNPGQVKAEYNPIFAKNYVAELVKDTGENVRFLTDTLAGADVFAEHPYLQRRTIFNDPRHAKIFSRLGETMPSLAVAAGLTVATGNPYAGVSLLGLGQGADTYENLRDKEQSLAKASTFGLLDAIGTAVFAKIPLKSVLGGHAGRAVLEEGMAEGVQQIWTNLMNILGGDDTRRLFDGLLEAMVLGAAAGGLGGGFFRLPKMRDIQTLENRAKDGGVSAQDMDAIKLQAAGVLMENALEIEAMLQQGIRQKVSNDTVRKIWEDTDKLREQSPTVGKLSETAKKIQKPTIETKPVAKTAKGMSRLYENTKREMGFGEAGVNYDSITEKAQSKQAFEYIENNPGGAMRAAYGIDALPYGLNPQVLRAAVVAALTAEGKLAQAESLMRLASSAATEAGQTLAMTKLFYEDSLGKLKIIRDVETANLTELGKRLGDKKTSVATARIKIKQDAKIASEQITKNQAEQTTMQEVDQFINDLIC